MGACKTAGGDMLTDAFGIVAMVAMTPLVTIQLLGLYGKLRKRRKSAALDFPAEEMEEGILYFD